MRRTAAILGVAAAMAIAPSIASAATSPPKKSVSKKASVTLQTKSDGVGHTLYRLGDSGLWMY